MEVGAVDIELNTKTNKEEKKKKKRQKEEKANVCQNPYDLLRDAQSFSFTFRSYNSFRVDLWMIDEYVLEIKDENDEWKGTLSKFENVDGKFKEKILHSFIVGNYDRNMRLLKVEEKEENTVCYFTTRSNDDVRIYKATKDAIKRVSFSTSKYKENMEKASFSSTLEVIGYNDSYIFLCGRSDKQKLFIKVSYKQLFEKDSDDGFAFINSLLSGGQQIALKFPEVNNTDLSICTGDGEKVITWFESSVSIFNTNSLENSTFHFENTRITEIQVTCNNQLVGMRTNKGVMIWDLFLRKLLLNVENSDIKRIQFIGNNQFIAFTSYTAEMWEINSSQLLYSFPVSLGHRWESAFDFGGKMGKKFAIFNGPELKVWDIEASETQLHIQIKAEKCIHVTKSGWMVFVVSDDKKSQLFLNLPDTQVFLGSHPIGEFTVFEWSPEAIAIKTEEGNLIVYSTSIKNHVVLDGKFTEIYSIEAAINLGGGKIAIQKKEGPVALFDLEQKNEITCSKESYSILQRASKYLAFSRKTSNALDIFEVASVLKGEFTAKATITTPGKISMIANSDCDRVACIFVGEGGYRLGVWQNSGNKFSREVETGSLLNHQFFCTSRAVILRIETKVYDKFIRIYYGDILELQEIRLLKDKQEIVCVDNTNLICVDYKTPNKFNFKKKEESIDPILRNLPTFFYIDLGTHFGKSNQNVVEIIRYLDNKLDSFSTTMGVTKVNNRNFLFGFNQDSQEMILVDASFRLPETKRLHDLTTMSSSAVGLFVLFEKLAKHFHQLPVSYIDDKKNTPLHFLAQNDKNEYVERLLNLIDTKTKPLPLSKNTDNVSALTVAIQRGNKKLIEVFLNYLLKVPAIYRGEISSNIYLLAKKYPEILSDLLNNKLKLEKQDPSILLSGGFDRCEIDRIKTIGSDVTVERGIWKQKFPKHERSDQMPLTSSFVSPIPNISSFVSRKDPTQSPLYAIANFGVKESLKSEAIRVLIENKWDSYGRNIFLKKMLLYFLFVALFSVFVVFLIVTRLNQKTKHLFAYENIQDSLYDVYINNGGTGIVRIIIQIVIAIVVLFNLQDEARQFWKDKKSYFKSVWNYLDLSAYTLVVVTAILHLVRSKYQWVTVAPAAILFWFKLLFYMRGSSKMGPFVRTLFQIAIDIRYFLIILTLITVGFSFAFLSIVRDGSNDFDNFGSSFFSSFRMIFGDNNSIFSDDVENLDIGYQVITKLLYAFFTVIVSLIMLNLLIALMSASFEKVQEQNEIEWRLEMANILVEIEMFNMGLLNFRFFGKPLKPDEMEALQPKWLHVLAPSDSDWGKSSVDKLEVVADNLHKAGKENVSELKQEFQKQIEEMKKEFQKILIESQKPLIQEITSLKQQLSVKS